jgi:2-polyprenyl-3-methyl-5-hydroxy-6-metoxy-1,4-benzoquinol methylase
LNQGDSRIEAVESYWDRHVDKWKIASHEPGTPEFFRETEQYRFEKLHYLNERIPFGEWSGCDVLEIGCGLGNDLSRFAVAGARVTGIDLSSRAIALSRANFEQRQLPGEFQRMNGEDLQFDDNSFDLCYCHTVLQFTPNPGAMVAEIHRVLKPGGQAIIMALNKRSWLMFLQRVMKTEIDYMDAPEYHLFSAADLSQMMERFSGLNIVMERFPVRTKIHSGLKALVYNSMFVDLFNALPSRMTRSFGHHILAFGSK